METLATSTVSGSGSILVLIWVLQNAIKLGKAVGLEYQSPPPPYFRMATCCAYAKDSEQQKSKHIKNVRLFMY